MAVNTSTGFCAALLGTKSFESIFDGGCIEVRSGVQPASADMAPTGVLLARISRGGAVWTPGSSANGLRFARNQQLVTSRDPDVWGLYGVANGVAGWARLRAVQDSGAMSMDDKRIDFAVGLNSAVGDYQMLLPTTSISTTTAIPISSWFFMFP